MSVSLNMPTESHYCTYFSINFQMKLSHTRHDSLESRNCYAKKVKSNKLTSLLSGSKCTLKVGSSFWNLLMPLLNFSKSAYHENSNKIASQSTITLFFGLIDNDITGSGTWIDSYKYKHKSFILLKKQTHHCVTRSR